MKTRRGDEGKAKKAKAKKTPRSGWKTTDDFEVEVRRERAREEVMSVRPSLPGGPAFQDYWVERDDEDGRASRYKVEIRSLSKLENTCSCPDFRKNFLGTCKHIEKVLVRLGGKRRGVSPFVEIFMGREPYAPKIAQPPETNPKIAAFLARYLAGPNDFKTPVDSTLDVLTRDLREASPEVRAGVRVSDEVREYLRVQEDRRRAEALKATCAGQFREAAGNTGFLRAPLYDYQIDGMLHLAFSGRALLADEMGLGKTVQAVAAARLAKERFGVERVLVVSPASLKTEWEDQIRKFTNLPLEIVYGQRDRRLDLYKNTRAFFLLTNYEQVVRDYEDINRLFQPDLVILDEAQRIKNWQTKTATRLKRLRSRFAYVLTGTPIENRVDELYSLVEFIDPSIFGSLFRFNRRFYQFDDAGKAIGLKDLRELRAVTSKIMLRRRKDEIDEQLPERIDNNYFVEMTSEQRLRYEDNEDIVARLYSISKRRPLTPEEHERLQNALARMRMLCDTVYILDGAVRDAPKLDELERILEDLWADKPDRKIIVFSEWVRMLELLEERLQKRGVEYALHVGHVNQQKRREEINRFKDDPACKVFLSSDSGSVGLNLQVAEVVVNLDLPWNPARLEQRIARAWRKHQKNTVNVINLIASDTLEKRMLATLAFKKELADATLDGRGDFDALEQPNARASFMERLAAIMGDSAPPMETLTEEEAAMLPETPEVPPSVQLAQELTLENPGVGRCDALYDKESGKVRAVVAVGAAAAAPKLRAAVEKTHGVQLSPENLMVIAPETQDLLRRLAELGVITIHSDKMTAVFEAETFAPPKPSDRQLRLKAAREVMADAERRAKMAGVLRSGGFADEAFAPTTIAVNRAAVALYLFAAETLPEPCPQKVDSEMLKRVREQLAFDSKQLLFAMVCALDAADKTDPDFAANASAFLDAVGDFVNRQALT